MRYKDIVKDNYHKVKGDDSVMWASVALVDELLEEMREHHPERYWAFLRDTHELMCGRHFNEVYAKWQVSQMHHKSADGKLHKGEHWTKEETDEVYIKHRALLPSEITACDFYVALNAEWHDNIRVVKKRFADDAEADAFIIESALAFWFMDEDWEGNSKVWEYFRCKNK